MGPWDRLAGMGQWCGWRARADLWSAGIPAGMGGVVGPGSAGALAGMGQWCGWRASADLWSAGIPAGMGGVVGSRDVGGEIMANEGKEEDDEDKRHVEANTEEPTPRGEEDETHDE